MIPRPHRPRLDGPHAQFGAYVREQRLARHMTLKTLAYASGMAVGHLCNVEQGRVTPPAEPIILKMASTLEIPAGLLLARAGRLSPPDLRRFWASPLIPTLIMSSTGWTQDEAAIFQETILATLA